MTDDPNEMDGPNHVTPKDLTEFVVRNGAAVLDVQRLVDSAVPYVAEAGVTAHPEKRNGAAVASRPKPRPIAERVVDMADIGPPPADLPLLWWVLTEGMTHWLTAPSGAGKTTLAFNIVTTLAEGGELWGEAIPRPRRTVYVDLESGLIVQQTKLEKLYLDTPRKRDGVLFLSDIELPAELAELVAFCRERAVDLVVFDTAAKTWNLRDENDNSEIGRAVTPILETLKRAGIASLVIDHTGKNGSGARGASAKTANVDVVLDVDIRGQGNDAHVALGVTKHKLLGQRPPLVLRRLGNDRFERVEGERAGEDEEAPSRIVQCREAIVAALHESDAPLSYAALLSAVKSAGLGKSAFDRTLRRMKEETDVEQGADGYRLPDPFAD